MNRIRRSFLPILFYLVVLLPAGSLWLWAAASAWTGGQKWREGRRAAKG